MRIFKITVLNLKLVKNIVDIKGIKLNWLERWLGEERRQKLVQDVRNILQDFNSTREWEKRKQTLQLKDVIRIMKN